jgi:hypothetical protein
MSISPRVRRVAALTVLVGGLAAVAITVALAQDGGEDRGKLDPARVTPTAEATLPRALVGLDAASREHLSAPAVASADRAVRSGDAAATLDAWRRGEATCFVGSTKTGTLCKGLGPDGSEHRVTVVGYSSWQIPVAEGETLLRGLLAGNRAELALLGQAADTGHLLAAYRLAEDRTGVAGDPAAATRYLLLELDPAAAAPIVSMAALERDRSPVAALRQHELGGSLETVIAATDELVAEARAK